MTTFEAAMIFEGDEELAGCEITDEVFVEAAQHLIDTGAAWTLQGRIVRTCATLINTGDCHI